MKLQLLLKYCFLFLHADHFPVVRIGKRRTFCKIVDDNECCKKLFEHQYVDQYDVNKINIVYQKKFGPVTILSECFFLKCRNLNL